MPRYTLNPLEHAQIPEAHRFLREHAADTLFLQGNLLDIGTRLTDQPNSGNFRVLRETNSDKIVQVFTLTRRGNLLLSPGPRDPEALAWFAAAVAEEAPEIHVRGALGEWEITRAVWMHLASLGKVTREPAFSSQEILYELYPLPVAPTHADARARLLTSADFEKWEPLRLAFWKEEGIPNDTTPEGRRAVFGKTCALSRIWGVFEGEELVSTALLNAVAGTSAQVGGVYTLPDRRGEGCALAVMRKLLSDCQERLGIERVILTTGRANVPAQGLYEKLHFRSVGRFGIFLEGN